MKANVKLIRKKRSYSKEFKQRLVKEFEGGKYSVRQPSLLHNIKPQIIYNWIYKCSKINHCCPVKNELRQIKNLLA